MPRRERPALPQMRPLERRVAQQRRGKEEKATSTCFMHPFFFGGCGVCSVDDDRMRNRMAWDLDTFCKAGPDEYVEYLESNSADEEESSYGDLTPTRRSPVKLQSPVPGASPQRAEGGRGGSISACRTRSTGGGSLESEIDEVVWSSGDVFITRGWEIVHIHGDRYSLNGRSVKLMLLPHSAPVPDIAHVAPSLGHDVAERAARVMVCDGSLRQPLFDYLLQTGMNEQYDQRGTENPAGVTGAAKHLEFNVIPTADRLVAMQNATIQAEVRRRAQGGEPTRMSALQGEGGKFLATRPLSCGSLKIPVEGGA